MKLRHHKQAGLSLVELMVAIALSLILMAGVIQIFSSSKQTSRVQDALARLQENARFALDILGHDIRMAGQLGCNSAAHVNNKTNALREFGSGIFGYEYVANQPVVLLTNDDGTPSSLNPSYSDTGIVADTDAIVIMSASPSAITASSDATTVTAAAGNDFDTEPGTPFLISPGDPLIISDCENADIFLAGTVNDNLVDIGTSSFSKIYSADAELSRLNYIAYYIRESNNQKNLYRSYVNASGGSAGIDPEPLLEGVENLQIFYGEKINGNIRYFRADQVGDMNNVVSVRIHLLLSTLENNLASETQSYWYVNQDNDSIELQQADEGDRRLFRSFTSTIQLRNHETGT